MFKLYNFWHAYKGDDLMSKKASVKGGMSGWKYTCTCGYESMSIGDSVGHVNKNKGHQLTRVEL